MKKNRFEGKTALVTGAASGIGRATALAFAAEGAKVAVVDRTDGSSVVREIRDAGGTAQFFQCDVSKADDVEAMVKHVVEEFTTIDCAFNNAGIEGVSTPAADLSEADWDRTLDVNLKGVWLSMKHEIPYMLAAGGGAIVNCSSIAGLVGFPAAAAYTASKHGMIGLTKTAALDYVRQNIRVNAVCPGVIHTAMIDRYTKGDSKTEKLLASGEPIGRMGQPEEIASAVLYLSSDEASFITGVALAIDGGWVAQ
jgi:NAD(P)-dependent dehydrogenase (short-subunit alcohol dehydrogenase family)